MEPDLEGYAQLTTDDEEVSDEEDSIHSEPSIEEEEPKILLEVLSPGGARLVFLLVYACCAVAIAQYALAARATKATATALSGQTLDVISQDDATIWLARFPALGDVQGNVALRAIYPNQTAVHDANVTADDDATVDDDAVAASTLPVTYDIDVWATRSRNAGLGDAKTVVLQRNSETAYMNSEGGDVLATSTKVASWYQRSESVPSRSRVHGFLVQLTYCVPANATQRCAAVDAATRQMIAKGGDLVLKYHDLKPLTTPARAAARILLLVWWGLLFTAWAPYIRRGGALYLSLLLVGLLFFADPVDCVVEALPRSTKIPPLVAFCSRVGRRLGEATLLAALLLAADADGRAARSLDPLWRGGRPYYLLAPVVYGFCGVWAVFLQFPTLWGSDRPPTLALVSWPAGSLRAFAAAALGAVASGLAWGVLFVCLIVRAGRRLAAAPYARTRRHQLAFRFFALQASLVALFVAASFVIGFVDLWRDYRSDFMAFVKHGDARAVQDLAGALEALVTDDVRDLAEAYCFAVYVALLLYVNLPPPQNNDLLTSREVVRDERDDKRRRRRRPHARPAFVVETARWLAEVSDATYGDGTRDLECGMVNVTRLAHEDTRGIVALRARDPSHVVVAFRGTASASQISTNADVRLKRIVTPSAPDEPPPPPVLRSESSLEDDDEPAGNGRLGLDLLVRTAAVAVDVTARGGDLLQDFARGLLNASGAVDVAPGLASTVEPCVHNGFWTAYAGVRPQLERALSEALATNEVRRVSFTGHSLGGALAQLASADFASGALCPTQGRRADCVTFGAPRVGNAVWARAFSKLVPEAWRVVCDGDVIAFLRGCGYVHAGVEVVVDASAQTPGYVVVDPTPVEKKLRLGCGKSVAMHKLAAYRKGLWGAAGCRGDPPARRARHSESPAPPVDPPTVSCCWRTTRIDVDSTPLI